MREEFGYRDASHTKPDTVPPMYQQIEEIGFHEHCFRVDLGNVQGRNWIILKGGRRYICHRKDEIVHGLLSTCNMCCASI